MKVSRVGVSAAALPMALLADGGDHDKKFDMLPGEGSRYVPKAESVVVGLSAGFCRA